MVESSRLKEILAEEVRLLKEMVALEEKTMQILMEGNACALAEANLQKEELVKKMAEIEKQRRVLLPSGVTLREFCRRENPPDAGELEELRLHLLRLHSSLQRMLKLNRNLLKHNLRFVEYALNIIFPRKEEPLYASSGKVKEQLPLSTGLVDSNA
jgi:flagellar biosynthesis/type III secretory pathway chaperone